VHHHEWAATMVSERREGGLDHPRILKFVIFRLNLWVEKCFSLHFELVKWNFTIAGSRPVTSLGHQGRRRVFWGRPKFYTHSTNTFFQGDEKFPKRASPPAPRSYGPGWSPLGKKSFRRPAAAESLIFICTELFVCAELSKTTVFAYLLDFVSIRSKSTTRKQNARAWPSFSLWLPVTRLSLPDVRTYT